MRVLISSIEVLKDRYYTDYEYFYIQGQLSGGLRILIEDYHFDLRKYVGQHIDMLLMVMRSPYLEHKLGTKSSFLPEKYFSIKIVNDLKKELSHKGYELNKSEPDREIILKGDFIHSYTIPEDWDRLITDKADRAMLINPSALKTEDGVFLLRRVHTRTQFAINKIPKPMLIGTGLINLVAWRHELLN
ncbi:MAG TPA: hypothetical protein ENI29_16785 [bacterium]|nr:hypothetical protein [bacterium]